MCRRYWNFSRNQSLQTQRNKGGLYHTDCNRYTKLLNKMVSREFIYAYGTTRRLYVQLFAFQSMGLSSNVFISFIGIYCLKIIILIQLSHFYLENLIHLGVVIEKQFDETVFSMAQPSHLYQRRLYHHTMTHCPHLTPPSFLIKLHY